MQLFGECVSGLDWLQCKALSCLHVVLQAPVYVESPGDKVQGSNVGPGKVDLCMLQVCTVSDEHTQLQYSTCTQSWMLCMFVQHPPS